MALKASVLNPMNLQSAFQLSQQFRATAHRHPLLSAIYYQVMLSIRLILQLVVGIIIYSHDVPVAQALAEARGAGEYYVYGVVVRKEYRRKNIGRFLMTNLLEYLIRVRGARRIILDVEENNEGAIRLFLSVGFRNFRLMHRMRYEESPAV